MTDRARRSARADGQQDFLAERVLELVEIERRLTFVAEHFEHGRPAFIGHFHAAILQVHDVHLERLDLKVPIVAAIWTSQRHKYSLTHPRAGETNYKDLIL